MSASSVPARTLAAVLPPVSGYLFRSDFHDVWRLDGKGILAASRTSASYPSISSMESEMTQLGVVFQGATVQYDRLILDSRMSPGRNDAAFEASFLPRRKRALRGFRRVAILASTAVGTMQIQRHRESDENRVTVFSDVDEALAWLSQG